MEYVPIERSPEDFQQSILAEQIIAMCQRAFGETIQVESARELPGGLYNTTYLVCVKGMLPVILRVGPHASRHSERGHNPMRNEYAAQPFLSSIAPLLPRTIMADFTHQILEQDYMFQTYMEGEQWAQIDEGFSSDEKISLWRQLGTIVKKIHSVKGSTFSNAITGPSFSSWSQVLQHRFTDLIQAIENVHLDSSDVQQIQSIAQAQSHILDEITQPHLLHGDLWTVNILVKRDPHEPKISAILDSDGASWGDPMSDWTMFLLQRNAGTEVDAFWQTYGQPESSPTSQFRMLIYQGFYIGGARVEHHRLHHPESVQRSYRDIHIILTALQEQLSL